MRDYDVLALGELLIDFATLSTDESGYPTMKANPGGGPANFLAAVARHGNATGMLGKVGKDTFGDALLGTLEKQGIDTCGMVSDPDVFTTLAFVTFDAHGDRRFAFARKPGADTCLRESEVRKDMIDRTKILHYSSLSLTAEPSRSATYHAVEYARSQGKLVTYDPNLRPPLWDSLEEAKKQILWGLRHADVVKISDNEVEFLFGDLPYEECAKKILTEFGVRLVLLTKGKEGCIYCNRNAIGSVPAMENVKPVDTTGAGDIFGGSAVWKLLQTGKLPEELTGEEMAEICHYACTAAGLSTQRSGGISSVPSPEEIASHL